MARKLSLISGFVSFRKGVPVYGKVHFGQYQGSAGEERRPVVTQVDGGASAWLPGHANLVRLLEQTTTGDVLELLQQGQKKTKTAHGTKLVWQYEVSILEPREVEELDDAALSLAPHLAQPKPATPREPGSDDDVG